MSNRKAAEEASRVKRYCNIPVAIIPATQNGPMRTSGDETEHETRKPHLDPRISIDNSSEDETTGSESSFDELRREYDKRMYRESSRERLQQEQSEENEEDRFCLKLGVFSRKKMS